MKILIDTQILIWAAYTPERIPKNFLKILEESQSIHFSILSLIEIGIKTSINKLQFSKAPSDFHDFALDQGWFFQSISKDSPDIMMQLPFIHRDPFDRLMLAETLSHDCILMTTDKTLRSYDVPLL